MKLRLVDKRSETGGAVTFEFSPELPVTWQAGQFMTYSLSHENPDDRGTKRFFTISAAPFEKNIRITTRIAYEKSSSFKTVLNSLPIGGEIEARGPSGEFVMGESAKKYLFIAGGIGITPYRSILTELAHDNQPMNITLLYANKTLEAVFKQELDVLASSHPSFQIHYVVDPQKIDLARIEALVPDFKERIVYIAGPEPMVEALFKTLTDAGLSRPQIVDDYFPGYDWP